MENIVLNDANTANVVQQKNTSQCIKNIMKVFLTVLQEI